MTDYAAVLTVLYPGAEWSLNANDFDTLDWRGPGSAPAAAELDAAWGQVQYQMAYAQVEAERRAAYERDADPLFFQWQRGDGTEQAWLDAVALVKASHPYPVAP